MGQTLGSNIGIESTLIPKVELYLLPSSFLQFCRPHSSSTPISKLTKSNGERSGGKKGEKKETPQERLKRIMSKQLTKQSKDGGREGQENNNLAALVNVHRQQILSRPRHCVPSTS